MKEILKKIKFRFNFPLLAFMAYVAKMLVISPSFPDAIVMGVLAALLGYKMKVQMLEPKPMEDKVKKEIQEIKNALSKVNLAKITETKKYF